MRSFLFPSQTLFASLGLGTALFLGTAAAQADDPASKTTEPPLAPAESFIPPSPGYSYRSPESQLLAPESAPARAEVEKTIRPGHAVLPPPGTLGQTYLRTSWPIPKDEHPRTAFIQIEAKGYREIEIQGLAELEGFQRPDGVWVFKTERPLIPGVSHIYHVGARDLEGQHFRTVRLIPGRVVTLHF